MSFSIHFFVLFSLLYGCAGITPKYADDAQKTFTRVENIPLEAAESYDKTLAFLAQNLGNSNDAIQIKNREKNLIASNIILSCNFKTSFGTEIDHKVRFSFEFQAKDRKTRIEMKAMKMIVQGIASEIDITQESVPFISSCQQKFTDRIVANLATTKEDW